MMDIDKSILVVIDVQEKLAGLMHEHDHLMLNVKRAIHVSQLFNVPILWSEQAPDKIGPTVEEISSLLFPLIKPIHKRTFSCYENAEFRHVLDNSGRTQVLVVGIESHVCVYQTARDMKRHGYEVAVAFDAISSRAHFQKEIAVNRMRGEGVLIVSSEMIACEWLKHADHPKFREVMSSIKR